MTDGGEPPADATTPNAPPVANAGGDRAATLGELVTLDGSGSTDPDGDELTFAWTLISQPAMSSGALSDPSAVRPSITLDRAGTYVLSLVVNDGALDSAPDLARITTGEENLPPVAEAGPDQQLRVGDTARLDGTSSSDPDGDTLTPLWTIVQQPPNSGATLDDAAASQPTFVLDEPGDYRVELIVSDGELSSPPDSVLVTTENTPPVADAGAAQMVFVGAPVDLDGSGSSDVDGDPLAYAWSFVSRPTASNAIIDDPTAEQTRFTPDQRGLYVVQLIVNDGTADSAPDTTSFDTDNRAPSAAAGSDQQTRQDATVWLDGSASSDPDGDPLDYRWSIAEQPPGSAAQLSDSATVAPALTPDLEGTYRIELIVNDGALDSPADLTIVTVSRGPPIITAVAPSPARWGELLTISGTRLRPPSGAPLVAFAGEGGPLEGSVVSFDDDEVVALVPAGAITGPVVVDRRDEAVTSPSPLVIRASSDFQLQVRPARVQLIAGDWAAYAVTITSSNGFALGVEPELFGLPPGVTGSLRPHRLSVARPADLILTADAAAPPATARLTVSATVTVDGIAVIATATVALEVLPVTTSFAGRAVVSDDDQTPLAGVTVTLLGRDDTGQPNGCTGQTTSDAAGNFVFTDLPPECEGRQMIRYNGLSASDPDGEYAGVDLAHDINGGQVNRSVLVHLPRIDDAETVMVRQNHVDDQIFEFDSIPDLSATVYAGTTLTMPDGTTPDPFPLIAIEVAVDRLPDPMPEDDTYVHPFIVAFQPANAMASQPVAVSFPNRLDAPPGAQRPLATLDPTLGVMVQYGFGTVSADGRQVVPDLDPAYPGHRFGLVHFDWHGQLDTPNEIDPAGCVVAGDPVDLATGILILRSTDMLVRGSLGDLAMRRVYRTRSTRQGPFGIGSSHELGYRLDTATPSGRALVSLIMPNGSRRPFARVSAGRFENTTVPGLRGARIEVRPDHSATLHMDGAAALEFMPRPASGDSVLRSISDRNGNTFRLLYSEPAAQRLIEVVDPVGRRLRMDHDGADRITRISDPIGREVRYTYDAGYLDTVTDPSGGVTTYRYDVEGRLEEIVDPRGVIALENTYDAQDRVVHQVMADGETVDFEYTPMNPLVRLSPILRTVVTDARGYRTSHRFDPQGFLLSTTDALGRTRRLDREAGSNQLRGVAGSATCRQLCTMSAATDQRYEYDAQGRLTRVEDALGVVRTVTYDARWSRAATMTDALGHQVQHTYDIDGNLASTTNATGDTWRFTRDPSGLLVELTDPEGHPIRFEYDQAANLIAVTNAVGDVTQFRYDAVSRPIGVIDGEGREVAFGYDALDRVTTIDTPDGNTTIVYDMVGNATSVTDPRGQDTAFTYDAVGRPLSRTDALGATAQWTYDATGNATAFTDRTGLRASYTYDGLGRQVLATYADAEVAFRFDAFGRLNDVHDSASGRFTFAYHPRGGVARKVSPYGAVTFARDALSRVTRRTVTGGPQVSYTYDAAGRPIEVATAGARVELAYDGRGLLQEQSRDNGVVSSYSYDDAGRLTELLHWRGAAVLDRQRYAYDRASRRTSRSSAFQAPLTTPSASAEVDDANRLLRFAGAFYTHDARGNLQTVTSTAGTDVYRWDARGRLTGVERADGRTVRFGYNFDRRLMQIRRLTAGSTTAVDRVIADDLDNPALLLSDVGEPRHLLSGRRVDAQLAVVTGTTATYPLHDGSNSTVALTGPQGVVTGVVSYEPYGQSTSADYPFLFTGRAPVGDGLYYYRARFYDSRTGRFISEDPIGLAGGGTNLYGYAGGDPVNFVDPLGLEEEAFLEWSEETADRIAREVVQAGQITQVIDGMTIVVGYDHSAARALVERLYYKWWQLDQARAMHDNYQFWLRWNDTETFREMYECEAGVVRTPMPLTDEQRQLMFHLHELIMDIELYMGGPPTRTRSINNSRGFGGEYKGHKRG